MKPIAAFVSIVCLWLVGHWLIHLSTQAMLLSAGILVLLAMVRELWWSERAYRSVEHERQENLAREREFERVRQRERGY